MKDNSRFSGIEIIGDLPWGTHFCQFYQNTEDLMEILIPYFREGLENSEICIWILPSQNLIVWDLETAKGLLRKGIPNFDYYLEKGQIKLISQAEQDLKEDALEVERNLESLKGMLEKVNQVLASGYAGLRLALDGSFWLADDLETHAGFEENFKARINGSPVLALSAFPFESCSPTDIIEIVANHDFALGKKKGKWEQIKNPGQKKDTESKQIEEMLRESEQRFRIMFEAHEAPMLLIEPESGQIIDANEAAVHFYEYPREQLLGMRIDQINQMTPEEVADERHKAVERSKNMFVFSHRLASGDVRLVEVYSSPIKIQGLPLLFSIIHDITARHQAEEALRKSEERYRLLFTNITEAFFLAEIICDENGKAQDYRFLEVNPAFESHVGVKREEVLGKSHLEVFHKADPLIIEKYGEVAISGKAASFEFFSHVANRYIDIHIFSPEKGKFAGIFRDVTRRKQAEYALKMAYDNLEERVKERTAELKRAYERVKESEKELAEAQKMAHLGNWIRDLTANRVYWSDEVYRIFGFKPQEFELTYDLFLSRVHPDDRDYVNTVLKKNPNGHSYEVDYRIISASGEERIVHSKGEVVFDKEKKPVRTRGTIQDITEQKRAEKEREQLLAIIQQEKDRLSALINSITDEVWFADTEENFALVNSTALDEFNINPDEKIKIGKFLEKLDVYLPDGTLRPIEDSPALRALQGEVVKNEEELVRIPSTGELRYRQVKSSPVHAVSGSIIGSVSVARDITEQKKAEKALAKIEKARMKEIHHRIKNNLQVISSLLDLQAERFSDIKVLDAFKDSQNRVASMALIHEELYRGKSSDSLDFAEYLRKLTLSLLDSYKLENDSIMLKLDLEEEVHLNMDTAIPLGIIVNELVTNSLKHAFPEKAKGEIYVGLHMTADSGEKDKVSKKEGKCAQNKDFHNAFRYKLSVSDNGKGISEQMDFQNIDSLGLQLVNILIEQVEGCIELNKEDGTQFTLWFNKIEA